MASAKVAPGPSSEESVTLLKEEGSIMAYAGAVTTITFFTGGVRTLKVNRSIVAGSRYK